MLRAFIQTTQIIFIDKYWTHDLVAFTYTELVSSTLFMVPALLVYVPLRLDTEVLGVFMYLGLALLLQILGQRSVDPAKTAIIFLLELVLAAIFSHVLFREPISSVRAQRIALILTGLYTSLKIDFENMSDRGANKILFTLIEKRRLMFF